MPLGKMLLTSKLRAARPRLARSPVRTLMGVVLLLALAVHLAFTERPLPALPLVHAEPGAAVAAAAREAKPQPDPAAQASEFAAARRDARAHAAEGAREGDADCLPLLLYDKPMKTGSTAVTVALGTLLQRHDEAFLKCTLWPCGEYATELCLQRKPKIHLIDHIAMGVDTTHCLRRMGFYSVTSIRDPAERWNSAYKYNRWKKGNDYGISHNATYDDFMMKMPNCALLRYYDLGSSTCRGGTDDPEFQKRVQNIVTRFDEIIDLYGEAVTDLHKRLMPFLAQENVSEKKSVGNVPRDRMVYEQVLYEALVMRRFELAANPDPKRRLCKEPRVPK